MELLDVQLALLFTDVKAETAYPWAPAPYCHDTVAVPSWQSNTALMELAAQGTMGKSKRDTDNLFYFIYTYIYKEVYNVNMQ